MLAEERTQPSLRELKLPTYDRGALTPAIVHIGVGGFHRAHQEVYLDELASRRISDDWGVIGVGLRSGSGRRELLGQDCLYSVLQRDPDGDDVRVVGTLLDYLYGPENQSAVLAAIASPRTRVVSLTVTGEGYGLGADDELDAAAPDIARDLVHPGRPSTLPGYLAEGLRLRRQSGAGPLTVLSCDNLPGNGTKARRAVVSFARLRDERLADWIEENVSFPATVVDRIAPQATAAHRGLLAEYGVRDRWPAVSEGYSQWIVADDFRAGRPPLEEVGVRFAADLTPYELHKKRLLNGTHCALGYLGYLSGHRRIDEAIADPVLRNYAEGLMAEEVAPLLPAVLGVDLAAYRQTLLERFANPRIGDPLQRLCGRGSTKMPAYLLPSLAEAMEQGRPHRRLALAVAAWFRYLRGVDFEGGSIEVRDAKAATLQPLAREGGTDPRPLLGVRSVFGRLGEDEGFVALLEETMRDLERRGPVAAIADLDADRLTLAA